LEVLEIAQAAVDQLGRGRRGRLREIALLHQQHLEAAARRVARDAGAVDAAADDEQVVVGHAAGDYKLAAGTPICRAGLIQKARGVGHRVVAAAFSGATRKLAVTATPSPEARFSAAMPPPWNSAMTRAM